jgi:outer membrane beta-barrel protein
MGRPPLNDRIRRRLRFASLLVLLASAPLASAEAPTRAVHVIEQRPFIQRLRVELVPTYGYTLNEVLFDYHHAGGDLRFHINEEWAIAGSFKYAFASNTPEFDEVQSEFEVFPEKRYVRWYAGGEVSYTPFYGKFILFGSWIVPWNAWLSAGGGVVLSGVDQIHPAGTVGVGTRMFLTRWLTLNVELKDTIYSENYKAGDQIVNNLVFQTGFGLWFPVGWDYEFPR